MAVALAVLLAVVLVIGGITGIYSFSPAGPSVEAGRLPVVDAPAQLRDLAPRVPVPLRIPAVPPGWRSNSVGQDRVEGGGRAVRTGYLTPDNRYLRLLQSDVSEQALLAVEFGATPVPALGAVDVGGQRWVVYRREGDEPVWIGELANPGGGSTRVLITGSGSDDDLRALAGAVVTGELLPVGS